MKYLFILLIALCPAIHTQAQISGFVTEAVIKPYTIDITWHKTTMLIFPFPIKSADRGDNYILAEKVKGSENVLKVKAGLRHFEQSNLQVITSDGKVYAFDINYADTPAVLTIDLRRQSPYGTVIFKGASLNSGELEHYSITAAAVKPLFRKGRYDKHGIEFLLQGTYIKNDVIFLRYLLKNKTSIRYDTESLRFYVRDRKKAKRTSVQDKESEPLYVYHSGMPEEGSGQVIVIAFPKFTIADEKYFTAEITEKNGDRNPVSKLYQKQLLKANVLE